MDQVKLAKAQQEFHEATLKYLSHLVDLHMIEDAEQGFSHGVGATHMICRAEVDTWCDFIGDDKDRTEFAQDVYDYYYETYIEPLIKR